MSTTTTLAGVLIGILIVVPDSHVVKTAPIDTCALAVVFALTVDHAIQCVMHLPFYASFAVALAGVYVPCVLYALYYRFLEPTRVRQWRHAISEANAKHRRGTNKLYALYGIVACIVYTVANAVFGLLTHSILEERRASSMGWALALNVSSFLDMIATVWMHDASVRGIETHRGYIFDSLRWYIWYDIKAGEERRCCSARWPLLDTLFLSDPPRTTINWYTDLFPYFWYIIPRPVPRYIIITDEELDTNVE